MSDFEPTSPESYQFWRPSMCASPTWTCSSCQQQGLCDLLRNRAGCRDGACKLTDGIAVGMAMVRLEIDYRKEIRFPPSCGWRKATQTGQKFAGPGLRDLRRRCLRLDSFSIAVRFDPKTRGSKPFTDESVV